MKYSTVLHNMEKDSQGSKHSYQAEVFRIVQSLTLVHADDSRLRRLEELTVLARTMKGSDLSDELVRDIDALAANLRDQASIVSNINKFKPLPPKALRR